MDRQNSLGTVQESRVRLNFGIIIKDDRRAFTTAKRHALPQLGGGIQERSWYGVGAEVVEAVAKILEHVAVGGKAVIRIRLIKQFIIIARDELFALLNPILSLTEDGARIGTIIMTEQLFYFNTLQLIY